ncbi:MAG: hypothetical protein V1659_01305 [Candidatus Woesearchaeota archaeon]
MGGELSEAIKQGVEEHIPLERVRAELISKGFLEKDVDSEIEKAMGSAKDEQNEKTRKLNRLFSGKEVLDKLGYGFANHQFMNILFFHSGASLFFIGLINGFRTIISTLIALFLKEYSKVSVLSKRFIAASGIMFGFSFFLMAVSVLIKNPWLFAIALLLGIVGVAAHGDAYNSFLKANLKKERRSSFLRKISINGLVITAISLLLSGVLIDYFSLNGSLFNISLFGMPFKFRVYGFLLCFEITAFAFIFSSLIISTIKDQREQIKYSISRFTKEFCSESRKSIAFVCSQKSLKWLMISTIVTSALQLLGNSYYGIFIYNAFKNAGFGGFLNVAAIFLIASIISFIGPYLTKKLHSSVGISPMIVFGTMLIAMMPISLAFNPGFFVILLASAISIIGSAIAGVAQGLLAERILSQNETKMFFSATSLLTAVFFLVLIPAGAFFTQHYGMASLFKIIVAVLLFIVTPLNFIVVVLLTKTAKQAKTTAATAPGTAFQNSN